MKTIETRAVVSENRKLTLQAPDDVRPGEYQVVVIIDEGTGNKRERPSLDFPVDSYGPWPSGLSLRREDLYDDNGK